MKKSLCEEYMLVPKALFFLCSCFMYAPLLFQTKYIVDIWKIPVKNFGYMNLSTMVSIFASLGWSGLADRYQAHKNILMFKCLMYGFMYCSMLMLEPFMPSWTINFRMSVLTVIYCLTAVCYSAIFPLLSTLVFSILSSSESLRAGPIPPKRLLGRQKLFGTLGIGIVYAINGTMTDYIGYHAQFLIVSVSCLLFVLVAHFGLKNSSLELSRQASFKLDLESKKKSDSRTSWLGNVVKLLKNLDFLLLLIIVFLIGVCGSVFNFYFSVFMGKVLQGHKWKNRLMGYMNASRLAVEIPIYIWGDVLLGCFGSYGVLFIGMFSSALRPLGYSFFISNVSTAFWGFPFELLKGSTHACNGLAGCVLASDMAPPGAQGTAQALFTSSHHHAASTIAGIVCSMYLSRRKVDSVPDADQIMIYRDLFFWTGIIGLFGTVLNAARLFYVSKKPSTLIK
jgi:hypothetical protein